MTNNNQVNWDEIPEDVEVVVTYELDVPTYFKGITGNPLIQNYRHHGYEEITCVGIEHYKDTYGDRFHLRPSPTSKPTSEPPESTQVESSEVEATTTPEFDWSSVDEDVEAVILHGSGTGHWCRWYKTEGDHILVRYLPDTKYVDSCYTSIDERISDAVATGSKFHIRPPATTTPSEKVACKVEFYEGELPEGMINLDDALNPLITPPDADMYDIFKGADSKPSISTILQEAQQSILKHHGVTGKVKFTVEYSE